MGAGVVGDDPRQSRFADPGRAMEDQVADPIGLDGTAQEPSVGQDPALTFKFLQRARTHAVCQGGQPPSLLLTVKSEKVLTQRTISDYPVSLTLSINAVAGPNRKFFGVPVARGANLRSQALTNPA